MQSSNPAFNMNKDLLSQFETATTRSTSMTVQGTVVKTFVLLAILMATAAWSWTEGRATQLGQIMLIGSLIASLILFFITVFKPHVAPYTSPLYAACEGILLGSFSQQLEQRFPGIAFQAVAVTGGVTFMMLVVYGTGLIKVTGQLRGAIVAATGAIALVYLGSMLLNVFGVRVPYIYDSGPIGIAFSLFVVGLAAFNLMLDFDFIEKGAQYEYPKAMEWYGAFALMVTLVWLYVEVIRLLSKLQSRR